MSEFQRNLEKFLKEERSDLLAPGQALEGLNTKLFFSKFLQSSSGCWIWTGARNVINGHGVFYWNRTRDGKRKQVSMGIHRITYLIYVGDLPHDLYIKRKCGNVICGNPACLELSEIKGLQRNSKNECINGHPFSEENTRFDRKRGYRICKACRLETQRRYRNKGVV